MRDNSRDNKRGMQNIARVVEPNLLLSGRGDAERICHRRCCAERRGVWKVDDRKATTHLEGKIKKDDLMCARRREIRVLCTCVRVAISRYHDPHRAPPHLRIATARLFRWIMSIVSFAKNIIVGDEPDDDHDDTTGGGKWEGGREAGRGTSARHLKPRGKTSGHTHVC